MLKKEEMHWTFQESLHVLIQFECIYQYLLLG